MDIQGFLEAKKGDNSCLEMKYSLINCVRNCLQFLTREFASEKIGRIFSAKSMSNADALGTGPTVKVKIGKKIGYERDSFIRMATRKNET